MVTADQIVAHLVGDYILQSDWMANEKTKRSIAALAHVLCYSLPFLFFRPSLTAWLLIVATHFVIDRWRLARYVVWAKNWIAPATVTLAWYWVSSRRASTNVPPTLLPTPPFAVCAGTGYPPDRQPFLAVWLLIIADNTLHLICNGIALRYL